MLEEEKIKQIIEGALLAADSPLTVAQLGHLFQPGELDEENASKQLREALQVLQDDAAGRGVELKRVASGYRYQVRQELSDWVSRLWDEKPPRYTRALLETLALIAYKQPVTRGDIEQVRGVSVSQNIMRTLIERDWIKVVGQKEVPGRPSLYGTTKAFLDYFNLKSLNELPPLPEIRQLIEPVLAEEAGIEGEDDNAATDGAVDSEGQADADIVTEAEGVAQDGELSVGSVQVSGEDDEAPAVEVTLTETEQDDQPESAQVVPLHPGVTPS